MNSIKINYFMYVKEHLSSGSYGFHVIKPFIRVYVYVGGEATRDK